MRLRQPSYDYIIVGAGSAGCVIANRLSADLDVSVLLIEAGRRRAGLYSAIPAGYYQACKDPALNWNYMSEPEPNLNDRRISVPRGKVVGGSSAINAMVYLRGQAADYDQWAVSGAEGWSFADCLPYFRRSESSDTGANPFRGSDGPLSVEFGDLKSPIFDAFLTGAQQTGYRLSEDLNGEDGEGFARLQATKGRGVRSSAATAYLEPVSKRRNLTLATDTHVHRVLVEGGVAKGVVIGQGEIIRAEREVVLCAGAINSPALLLHSGIGPAKDLVAIGIRPVVDLPGVGANLQDHLDIMVSFKTKKPISIAGIQNPLRKLAAGLRWLVTRDGVAASNIFEVGGFIRSSSDAARPDLQIQLAPLMVEHLANGFALSHGYSVHVSQLRQESRGTVKLRSSDSRVPPQICFNFLQTERDRTDICDGVERVREIAHSAALGAITSGEAKPGPSITGRAAILAHVRAHATTEFHPSCTCAMGTSKDSVVGPELKVWGIEGLRVADSAIMPSIVSANLNAPTIMIGEKAAELISRAAR